jgi:hypothetical protein
MRVLPASGAALVVGLLLLGGCGGHTQITDAKSPQAKACRAAIATRMTSAFAEGKPDSAEASLAMQRALSGEKPTECNNIADALGTRMIAELGSEHDQMMADQEAGMLATPIPVRH